MSKQGFVISKGDFYVWDKCPYRKWSQYHGEHSEKKDKLSSKEKFFKILNGEKVTPQNLEEALEIAELKKAAKSVDIDALLREEDEIARGKMFDIEVGDGIRLMAKPDLVTYADVNGVPYLKIYSFKTGDGLARKRDFESMLYAYVVATEYGNKVDTMIVKQNVRNGLHFFDEFTQEEIEDIKDILFGVAKKYIRDVTSEEPPSPVPGPHCVNCPLIESCPAGRVEAEKLEEKLMQVEWAKELASKLDKEAKEWAKSIRDKMLEEGKLTGEENEAIAEFFGGRYKIVSNVSRSWRIGTRKYKKSDIPSILAREGVLDSFKDRLDIRIDEEVAAFLESKGIPMKQVATKTISIKRS